MGTVYLEAGPEIDALVRRVMEKYHPDLFEIGVTVSTLRAFSSSGDPLKSKGYPADADIRVSSLEDRARGMADVKMRIDGARWEDMNREARVALIDHELEHIQVVPDKDTGNPGLDDLGRPKLTCRAHDWEIGGFDAVVRRHGENAPELRALRAAESRAAQGRFEFDRPEPFEEEESDEEESEELEGVGS